MKAPITENRTAAVNRGGNVGAGGQPDTKLGSALAAGAVDHAIATAAARDWLLANPGRIPVVTAANLSVPIAAFPAGTTWKVLSPATNRNLGARSPGHVAGQPGSKVTGCVDLIFADRPFNNTTFPDGCTSWCREALSMLQPGGRCVIRCLTQVQAPESKDSVFASLSRGAVGSMRALLLKVAMALQPNPESGVSEAEIWEAIHHMWSTAERVAACFGWPIQDVQLIDTLRSNPKRYSFGRVADYTPLMASAGFSVAQVLYPVYELGERCPTFVLDFK